MRPFPLYRTILMCALFLFVATMPLYGKEEKISPKEYGAYVKTPKGLVRLLPNILFNENGLIYLESNNPARFPLKDVEYFVIFGKYDMDVLTINPLLFFQPSRVGKGRFIFGQNIEFNTRKTGNDLYTLRPKGLLGRGYFALWIEDSVWDFVID
jgi:hypothetical protein